jgi:hypothetical protein
LEGDAIFDDADAVGVFLARVIRHADPGFGWLMRLFCCRRNLYQRLLAASGGRA